MMREMVIYFNSGNRARVDADRVVFVSEPATSSMRLDANGALLETSGLLDNIEQIMAGKILVNWDNVSFVRRWEEPKEDEDEG